MQLLKCLLFIIYPVRRVSTLLLCSLVHIIMQTVGISVVFELTVGAEHSQLYSTTATVSHISIE